MSKQEQESFDPEPEDIPSFPRKIEITLEQLREQAVQAQKAEESPVERGEKSHEESSGQESQEEERVQTESSENESSDSEKELEKPVKALKATEELEDTQNIIQKLPGPRRRLSAEESQKIFFDEVEKIAGAMEQAVGEQVRPALHTPAAASKVKFGEERFLMTQSKRQQARWPQVIQQPTAPPVVPRTRAQQVPVRPAFSQPNLGFQGPFNLSYPTQNLSSSEKRIADLEAEVADLRARIMEMTEKINKRDAEIVAFMTQKRREEAQQLSGTAVAQQVLTSVQQVIIPPAAPPVVASQKPARQRRYDPKDI